MGGEPVRAGPDTSVTCKSTGGSVVKYYPVISVDGPCGNVSQGVSYRMIPLICNRELMSVVVSA